MFGEAFLRVCLSESGTQSTADGVIDVFLFFYFYEIAWTDADLVTDHYLSCHPIAPSIMNQQLNESSYQLKLSYFNCEGNALYLTCIS